ncbi:MAG: FtsX-like permease family protein [Anaerolineae bacterium]
MTTSTQTTRNSSFTASVTQMTVMAMRYLSGRKLRTALTTLAIVLGVALIFAMNIVLPSVRDAFKQTLTTFTGADMTITTVAGESFTPDSVIPQMMGVDGVRSATGILRRQFTLPTISDTNLTGTPQITLVGVDPATVQDVHQFVVSEGRFLEAGDTNAVVIPAGLAALSPELHVGTTFPLITAGGLRIYTVVGLLAEQGNPSAPELYVTLENAQSAFNQAGLINTVEASVNSDADVAAVKSAVQNVLGTNYVLNADTSGEDATAQAFQIGMAMFSVLGFLALFLGAFLIFNTFRTVIVERRRDLGLLRAVGATRRQITTMILIESVVQGVLGSVIGVLLGLLMAQGFSGLLNNIWGTYMHRGTIQFHFDVSAGLIAIVLGVATAVIAGYFPARSAGKTSPLDALRPENSAQVHRAARSSLIIGAIVIALSVVMLLMGSKGSIGGAMLFLIGMIIAAPGLVLPASRLFSPLLTLWYAREGDLARGNLIRQPGRAAITGSTLMIGLATLVLMAALVLSFGDLLTNLANINFSSDILLMPQTISIYNQVIGADPALAERVRAVSGVDTVGTIRYANGSINGQGLQILGIDPQDYPRVASFQFNSGDAEGAFTALGTGRNAIVTPLVLSTYHLEMGSDFVMETADGPQTYHIVGVANDLFSFKIATMFVSQENLSADFHKNEDVLLMVKLTPGADAAAVMTQVQQIAQDYPQFTVNETGQYRDELLKTSSGAFSLFYLLAFLILIPAALGLLNTLTINILERTREIGVVRAVGGSRRQVQRIVTAEALLLGIFGSALGVLAGVAMSYGFILGFGSVGWQMPSYFPLAGVIAAIVVGVILALFAAILPARSVAKLDIIRALQYE